MLFCWSMIGKKQVPCLRGASSLRRWPSCAPPESGFLRFHTGQRKTFLQLRETQALGCTDLSSVCLCSAGHRASLMAAGLKGNGLVHHVRAATPVERSHLLKTCLWDTCETPSVYFAKQKIKSDYHVDSSGPSSLVWKQPQFIQFIPTEVGGWEKQLENSTVLRHVTARGWVLNYTLSIGQNSKCPLSTKWHGRNSLNHDIWLQGLF